MAVGGAWRARGEARLAGDRLAGVRREADAAAVRLRALAARARGEAPGLLPAAEALPAQVVAGLASALPGDARLERLSIDYARGGTLEMHVVARDAAAWDRLIAQLERSPEFREVAPGPETRDAEVRSVIRGALGRESAVMRPFTHGRIKRVVAVALAAAAVGVHLGVTVPARRQRDEAREAFARAREERERLRAEAKHLERRAAATVRAPSGEAAAARALRLSLLGATHGPRAGLASDRGRGGAAWGGGRPRHARRRGAPGGPAARGGPARPALVGRRPGAGAARRVARRRPAPRARGLQRQGSRGRRRRPREAGTVRARLVLAALGVAAVAMLAIGRVAPLPAPPPPAGPRAAAPPAAEAAPPSRPVDPEGLRDVFRFAEDPAPAEPPSSPARRARRRCASRRPGPLGPRLVGLVRRAGRLAAALAADGDVVLALPGENAAGVTVLTVGEEGVLVRHPDGREELLSLP